MNSFSSLKCRLYRSGLIILLGVIVLTSCSEPEVRQEAPDISDKQHAADRSAIRAMTDKVLLAMAVGQYEDLAGYIEPGRFPLAKNDKRLIGLMTARRLLGSSAATVILQHWDISGTEITFDDKSQQAVAKIFVKHRKGPNRRLQTDQFAFRFLFFKELNQWRFYVP